MIYRPKKVYSMWDVWAYWHEGTYYLYHLMMGPTSRQGWHGQGIAMATSADGVHWDEIGQVIPKDDDATGLGTGAVWKAADFDQTGRFILNYSTWRDWCIESQTIRFAESTDLIHWTKLGEESEFASDPKWYKAYPDAKDARWDCIYPVERPGGGLYGYWTALPNDRPGFGFGETLDGVHWTALEPPVIEDAGQGECGAIEAINGKHYMLYHGGHLTIVGDRPEGPFRLAKKNPGFLCGHAYFTRFFPTPDALLVIHQVMPRCNSVADGVCSLAPFKRAVVDDEGTLRLGYWEGNDALKAKSIDLPPLADGLSGPLGAARFFGTKLDTSTGIVLEGTLPLTTEFTSESPGPEASWVIPNDRLSGLCVEFNDEIFGYFFVGQDGVCEAGIAGAGGAKLKNEGRINREMKLGSTATFRLLVRDDLTEFYIDDIVMTSYSLPQNATGRIGLIGPGACDLAQQSKAWTFGPS